MVQVVDGGAPRPSDIERLYELGAGRIGEWLSSVLPAEARLTLRAEPDKILQTATLLDEFGWQLQQAELKKSIEFETAVRRTQGKLQEIHSKLKDLKLGRGGRGVPPVAEQLEELEAGLDGLREIVYAEPVVQLRHLARQKARCQSQMRLLLRERTWLETVARMEEAMCRADLDDAQAALEALDQSLGESEGERKEPEKRAQVEQLRNRLVTIIQEL